MRDVLDAAEALDVGKPVKKALSDDFPGQAPLGQSARRQLEALVRAAGDFDTIISWSVETWGGHQDLSYFMDSWHSQFVAEPGKPNLAREIVLETGLRQHEAISLYASSGFEPIPGFGYYAWSEDNRCFARRLVDL